VISISVKKPFVVKVDKQALINAANITINILFREKPVNLSILVCSDELITQYNSMYRGLESPTDVLSFDSDLIDPDSNALHLGDIVLSYETAGRQANEACHSTTEELIILLIHGILHLAGYNHDDLSSKEKMWIKQFQIHETLGIETNQLSGDNDKD
jgi:probable rRNA maturation factor